MIGRAVPSPFEAPLRSQPQGDGSSIQWSYSGTGANCSRPQIRYETRDRRPARPAARGQLLSDETAKDRRRLVLGAAVGFRVAQVRVFVESLRATGYAGDVTMLVGRFQWRLRAYLRRHGVRTLPHWSTRKLHGPIHAVRFERFARILRASAGRYDQVLVSDVRDVLFQKHPFADLASPACRFYLEAAPWTIGSEPTNRRWANLFLAPAGPPDRPVPHQLLRRGARRGRTVDRVPVAARRLSAGLADPDAPRGRRRHRVPQQDRASHARGARPRSWKTTSMSPPWGSRRRRPMWPAPTGSFGPPTGGRPRFCINMTASPRSSAPWRPGTGCPAELRPEKPAKPAPRGTNQSRENCGGRHLCPGQSGCYSVARGDRPCRPRHIKIPDA